MKSAILRWFICLIILALPVFAAAKPDFNQIHDYNRRKQAFIDYLMPRAQEVNSTVISQRKRLLSLYQQWQAKKPITSTDMTWVANLADQYKVKSFDATQRASWQDLTKRVDVVPLSMLLAQSANETSWGRSRIARQAKNYFGQTCPDSTPCPAHTNIYQNFPTLSASIMTYVHNMNTLKSYQLFRNLRYKLRTEQHEVTGTPLLQGIKYYSTRGQAYIRDIRTLIAANDLTQYDES